VESAQAQLDDARRLAAEASDKKSAMVQRKVEAEEALAEADRDKAEVESLLTEAEQAETDRLRIEKEIEVMPSREETVKRVRPGLPTLPGCQVQSPLHRCEGLCTFYTHEHPNYCL
jgi:hypothetical protein